MVLEDLVVQGLGLSYSRRHGAARGYAKICGGRRGSEWYKRVN
jgi:hypothetical protein